MDKWISVKDKLPENRQGKLILIDTGHIFSGYYDGNSSEWVSLFINGILNFRITHWMPLPKTPYE